MVKGVLVPSTVQGAVASPQISGRADIYSGDKIHHRAYLYLHLILSVWARTTKRGVSLPVSGQRLIVFFGKLIMSRTQNDVIAVWIL